MRFTFNEYIFVIPPEGYAYNTNGACQVGVKGWADNAYGIGYPFLISYAVTLDYKSNAIEFRPIPGAPHG